MAEPENTHHPTGRGGRGQPWFQMWVAPAGTDTAASAAKKFYRVEITKP